MSEKSIGNHFVKTIKVKRKTAIVVFSNGDKFSLSHNAFTNLRLYEGKAVDEEEYALIQKYGREDEYYTYALNRLNREIYTAHVLREKLIHKGADKDIAESVIARLVEEGLLNDADYARNYAQDVADFRMYGKRKTMQRLREKGVSAEILKEIDFSDEKEMERAIRFCKLLNKKLVKYPTAKKKEKAYLMLLDKGFESSVARKAIEEALDSTPESVERQSLSKDFYIARHKYQEVTPIGLKKKKVFAYLARKGYRHEEIWEVMEGLTDED